MIHRSDYRFFHRLRVRWAEADPQAVVYNGHYQMYCTTAAGEWWRAMGLPNRMTAQHYGADLYTRRSVVEYLASARVDDVLDIGVRCARVGDSSITLQSAVFRGEQLLVTAELVWVWVSLETGRSTSVPFDLRTALQDFEAGRPMFDVQVGPWANLGEPAALVRTKVFIEEQGIPADMEWDGADAHCTHAVAFNRLGQAVATGRLLEHVPGVAKIGRMAVLPPLRGAHVGEQVLQALMQAARQRGDREVLLHAQLTAEGFYRRAGFVARGPQFDEAGIAHVEMVKVL